MAQLNIRINGYSYTVGCADGEEDHLRAMAAAVEERVGRVKALGGGSGEARMLLLAALLMADELHDMGTELEAAQAGGAFLPAPAPQAAAPPPAPGPDRARLQHLAERAEEIATALEAT